MYINENAGINFIEVKGGMSTKALANAITKTHADNQVQHEILFNLIEAIKAQVTTF